MAMLHPQEQVIDYTKGQGKAAPLVVNINGAPVSESAYSRDGNNVNIDLVEAELSDRVLRGNGQLSTTIQNVFGLNRASGARR